jgi:hypothetical protein
MFSLDTPVSSTNKTDNHDIIVTKIFLKVVLNTITLQYLYIVGKYKISLCELQKQVENEPLSYCSGLFRSGCK